MKRALASALIVAAGCLAISAAPAAAADKLVAYASEGPGPEQFDRVQTRQIGPRKADRVLVLMPGTIGGAGDFTLIARDLVKRVDDLQVWAIDRRSQVLEDTSVFAAALDGEASLDEAFDYYLGWLTNGGIPADHFDLLDAGTVPFAREWGMKTALDDARRVVKAAGRKGREVILGGHSLGASLTAAYAAWDFNGRPGYKSVDGLVLIDGGLLGSFVDGYTLAEAQQQIADLETSNPFADLLGIGFPEAAGLFAEIGGIQARLSPTGPATELQAYPLLPDEFDPGVPVTNRALVGHAFDRDTSPADLGLLHVNAGGLAGSGDPRDWVDGGVTPVARLAQFLGQEPSNGVEWYFPRRLTIDTDAANELEQTEAAEFLGLRLEHSRRINVPIYAFQTDLTDGGVLKGARALVKRARTKRKDSMLVDGAPQQSHLDPLLASPKRNEFLKTVIDFLDEIE